MTAELNAHIIDNIAARDADDPLGQYESRLRSIEEAHGFDDGGVWPNGAAPAGYAEVREEYNQAWDGLFAWNLEEFGDREIGPVPAPREVTRHCRVGWDISGVVVKTPKGWRLLEVWNVSPSSNREETVAEIGRNAGPNHGVYRVPAFPYPD